MDYSATTDLYRFYAHLDRLCERQGGCRTLSTCTGRVAWAARGVYFFEPGEVRAESASLRVVRVGTHAVSRLLMATVWQRFATHRCNPDGGSHRGTGDLGQYAKQDR